MVTPGGAVGVIINPWAGKDVRRLHAPVGHTPDSTKIGIVRRVVVAALDAGASTVYAAADTGRIAQRAMRGIDQAVLVDGPGTGSALDTRRAAAQLFELGCTPIVVLGGDGTCRDVAIGAPDATLVAISTGTNNVFPRFVDGSSAGTAAGLLAAARVDEAGLVRRTKRLEITVTHPDGRSDIDIALVDVAAVRASDQGARAVVRAETVTAVVAAIAHPTSTGLSAIPGRVHPLDRDEDGAVHVVLAPVEGCTRRVRVPIVPGYVDVLGIAAVNLIAHGDGVTIDGPCVLAYDGERERMVPAGATATVAVRRNGPFVVDIDRTLLFAARHHLFDLPNSAPRPTTPEAHHGH